MALLEVEKLQTHFRTEYGVSRAVIGVSFNLDAGETLAIVGESGCGKSVTAMSILRLIASPPASRPAASASRGATCSRCLKPRCARSAAMTSR